MTIGLRIPVGVNESGRANVEMDDVEHNKKILFLAFGTNDDQNHFQDVGLDLSLIFEVRDASFRVKAERKINQILQKFSKTIKIDETKSIQLDASKSNEVKMTFDYIDLSVNEPQEFTRTFVR